MIQSNGTEQGRAQELAASVRGGDLRLAARLIRDLDDRLPLARAVLRLEPARIDPESPLAGLGVDSLLSLELRSRVEAGLGIRLSATVLFVHASIAALARHLLKEGGLISPSGAASRPGGPAERIAKTPAVASGGGNPAALRALERDTPSLGFQIGPAAARMTSAAAIRRSSVSHHGERDGVSSLGAMPNNSRVGGKSTRRGRGGITRSSHHSAGRLSRPASSHGSANESGSPIMRAYRNSSAQGHGCS